MSVYCNKETGLVWEKKGLQAVRITSTKNVESWEILQQNTDSAASIEQPSPSSSDPYYTFPILDHYLNDILLYSLLTNYRFLVPVQLFKINRFYIKAFATEIVANLLWLM